MYPYFLSFLCLASGWFFMGCSVLLPEYGTASVQQRATAQAQRSCGSAPGDLEPRLCTAGILQSVEPLYGRRQSRGMSESRLLGAQLRVAALPGLTAQWLSRVLKCHGAQRTLGELPEVPNDPYWLPQDWVDIEVQADSDGFLVLLRGEDPERAARILARASAFRGGAR